MKSAVLIIDLQVGLFEEPGKPFDYGNVVTRINALSSFARDNDIPVFFIQHETKDGVLKYNTPGWQLVGDLDVDPNDYFIRKTTPNSFHKTNLEEILRHENVKKIIVCGYATEFCVDTTVRAAAALGYQIDIVSDCHTTHDKSHASGEFIRKHHNETLPNITSFGVKITAVEAAAIMSENG